jgi:hypothetical protein
MPRQNIGMGFVEYEGLWLGFAGAAQQIEIAAHVAASCEDRAIVLHLARHQDVRARAAGAGQRACFIDAIFADPAFEDQRAQLPGAFEQLRRERVLRQQIFESAWPGGVIMHPHRVDDDRERRDTIGAQPDRADEAVLDLMDGMRRSLAGGEERRGHAGFPQRDRGIRRQRVQPVGLCGHERGMGLRSAPQQCVDGFFLPLAKAERRRDGPVGIDQPPPLGAIANDAFDRAWRAGEGIGPVRFEQKLPRDDLQRLGAPLGQRSKAPLGAEKPQPNAEHRRDEGRLVLAVCPERGGSREHMPRIGVAEDDDTALRRLLKSNALRQPEHQAGRVLSPLRLCQHLRRLRSAIRPQHYVWGRGQYRLARPICAADPRAAQSFENFG